MGGRQADADECYQFAEIGAVQDEEGNGWVCQNAWESFWIIASYAGSLLPQKNSLLSNTSGSDESLYKRRSCLPSHLLCPGLHLSCRGSSSPEDVTASASLASSDLTVKIPHSGMPLLPVLCAWNLHALFRAFLLQGAGIPERDCMVCWSLNQMKEQDLSGF